MADLISLNENLTVALTHHVHSSIFRIFHLWNFREGYQAYLRPREFKGGIRHGGHLAIMCGEWVIVSPNCFVAKPPAILFSMYCLSRVHLNDAGILTIICTGHAEWSHQIQRYNYPPSMCDLQNGHHAYSMLEWSKRNRLPLFKFFGRDTCVAYNFSS